MYMYNIAARYNIAPVMLRFGITPVQVHGHTRAVSHGGVSHGGVRHDGVRHDGVRQSIELPAQWPGLSSTRKAHYVTAGAL